MKIQDSGEKIDRVVLSELEKELNVKLPEDYKKFMIKNNGGTPAEDLAFDFLDVSTNKKNSSIIQSFFVIYDEETYEDDDLKKSYRILQAYGATPSNMLPLGNDPGGNFICMCISGENYGKVFFADHELEDLETGYMVMSIIADSFSEFIDKLYVIYF